MDFATTPAAHSIEDFADRKRLDSFRLGGPTPPNSHHTRKLSHSRSHSRNASLSTPSLSMSSSVSSTLPPLGSPPASPSSLPAVGNPKRNSHHRRRSSVSTRHESAEIMGVSVLTTVTSEDNVNLGDKDSIRRRALLTLEGRTDVGAFSKVEIPELGTPELERRFDFPTKPSHPPGIGAGFGGGLNSLAMGGSKRDSFGKFRASASSKELLGTLVEEDEEAEDAGSITDDLRMERTSSPVEMVAPEPAPAPVRHRPATLNLRPLSLAANHGMIRELPTPEPSPSYRPRPGLRALTLSPSLTTASVQAPKAAEVAQAKRHTMSISSAGSFTLARRQSLNSATKENTPPHTSRRSSISYFSSQDPSPSLVTGLPTPEMTPTSDRRYSASSESSSASSLGSRSSRSLSTSEHHFLYQAHTALVQRISDLERALSARPPSRPNSCVSEASGPSEPTDEILQLVIDLKAERDELKKDVDGWRTRVSDGANQVSLLMKRVEVERREAWVARERAGLIEIEKKSLEKTVAEKEIWGQEGWRKYEAAHEEMVTVLEECQELREKTSRCEELQAECTKLAAALMEERRKREEVERELDSLLTTPTPQRDSKYHTPPVSRTMIFAKRSGLGFRSMDSTGSFTDVESLSDPSERPQFSLKSVIEEDEHGSYSQELSQSDSSEVDCLAGYEDEDEDDDYDMQPSLSSSSFGDDDVPREISHLLDASMCSEVPELTSSRSTSSSPVPASPLQGHGRRASLVKAWTFPHAAHATPLVPREAEVIDHFFGCLEDVDNSPPIDSQLHSVESCKIIFSQALAEADDDLPPFYIPAAVGVEVPTFESRTVLDVVAEEDEEEVDESDGSVAEDNDVTEIVGQVVDGGIIFTFTPPPDFDVPEDVPVAQPASSSEQQPSSPESEQTSVSSKSSPSSIPRLAPKVFASSIPTLSSTPPRTGAVAFPRPPGSPSTFYTPVKATKSTSSQASSTPKRTQVASFIPQPRRSPVSSIPSRPVYATTKSQNKPRSSIPHVQACPLLKDDMTIHAPLKSPSPIHDSPTSPVMSPTLAALHTLTSFMPSLPWSSPKLNFAAPSAVASCIASSDSSGSSPSTTEHYALRPSTPPKPTGRTFVSRESQLAKLRVRLHQEHLQQQVQPRRFVARDYQDGILDI